MAAINAKLAKRLSAFSFDQKDEAKAKKQLIAYLKKNEVEGVEDETLISLLDMAEVFLSDDENFESLEEVEEEVDDEEVEDSEDETDGDEYDSMDRKELTKAIKEADPSFKVFKSMSDDDLRNSLREMYADDEEEEELEDEEDIEEEEVEEEISEEEDEDSGDEFDEMDRNALKAFIKENELDIKVFKNTTDDELREKIREMCVVEDEEVEEEDEEEEELEDEEDIEEEEEVEADEDPYGVNSMDRSEMKSFIKDNEFDIKVFKSTTDDELREKIFEAIASLEGDDEEEEPEEETSKKNVKKKVTNKEEEGYDELAEQVEKDNISFKKKSQPVQQSKRTAGDPNATLKFDARSIPEHKTLTQPFRELFDEKEFDLDILKQGFTVRKVGKNNKVPMFNYDELKVSPEGTLEGNLYLNRFKSVEDLQEAVPEEFQDMFYDDKKVGMFRGESHPCVRKISQEDAIALLESIMKVMIERAGGIDNKMGVNRQKLEETLSKPNKTSSKASMPVTKKIVKKIVKK